MIPQKIPYTLIILFTILAMLFPAPLSAQQSAVDTLNQTTEAGIRNGWWILCYPNGEKKEEGNYSKGLKEGIWTGYHPNGKQKYVITFCGGVAKGLARFYYEDGTLREEGFWNETFWTGAYHYYYPNGNKAYEWNYNTHGQRTGLQQYFHTNGKIKYRGSWENGQIDGDMEVFNEKGELTTLRHYQNGNFDRQTNHPTPSPETVTPTPKSPVSRFHGTGKHTIFRMDGKIEKKGYFRNGQLYDGNQYFYSNDSLIEIRIFKNGKAILPPEKKDEEH